MRLSDVEARLDVALRETLPGLDAQIRFAPRPRPGWRPGHGPEDARAAAALLLLFPVSGVAHVVLTVRSSHLPSHAGQVSLPGGAVEPDETIEEAALREAREEIALDPAGVWLLGRLTPLHIPVSGFMLNPVVGAIHHRPALCPADTEVERILEVDLEHLVDPARQLSRRVVREDRGEVEIPYIDIEGAELWGATAMVLAELLWLLRPPDPVVPLAGR